MADQKQGSAEHETRVGRIFIGAIEGVALGVLALWSRIDEIYPLVVAASPAVVLSADKAWRDWRVRMESRNDIRAQLDAKTQIDRLCREELDDPLTSDDRRRDLTARRQEANDLLLNHERNRIVAASARLDLLGPPVPPDIPVKAE